MTADQAKSMMKALLADAYLKGYSWAKSGRVADPCGYADMIVDKVVGKAQEHKRSKVK